MAEHGNGRLHLTYAAIQDLARTTAQRLACDDRVYGVPNGGMIPAALVAGSRPADLVLVEHPEEATVFVDDVIDSGRTRQQFADRFPDVPFHALVDKQGADARLLGTWVSFPWERQARVDGPRDNVVRILQYIGEDPEREGLRETPDRVVRSYAELYGGYRQDPAEVFKTFDGEKYDEMVLLRNVEFWSTCEHHLMPFFGKAHIAYIPDGPVVGLSKLGRLLDVFARRLQVQERLTTQITDAIDRHLKPKGSACVLEAKHLCMTCRGVQKQHSVMVTSSLTGAFREPAVRGEFFSLVRG